ncbi:MAG: hypothetical protein ORN85_04020 [Sediminibacterium sp.]|nr:hypothetical protein [Sediminibacterium sp.]
MNKIKPSKLTAQIFSYILHPVFLPLYLYVIYLTHFPQDFSSIPHDELIKGRIWSLVFNTIIYPLFSMFLLWKLNFVKSLEMNDRRERIIPLIILMFFYWWMFKLYRDFNEHNLFLKDFFFGCFMQTVIALVLISFINVSLHVLGIAGFLVAFIVLLIQHHIWNWMMVITALIIVSIVFWSRLHLKKHSKKELILALIVGSVTQLIIFLVL